MSKEDKTKEKKNPASSNGVGAPPDAAEGKAADVADAADAAEAAEATETAADDLPAQLAAAQQEAAEHKDNLLRAAAELENMRRRSEKKISEVHQFALSDFALAVGEVRDCLEAALGPANAEQHEKMREGVELTLRKLVAAMEARHILPIQPDIGATFDPSIHMAIGHAPASEQAAADTVAVVVQNGYMLNGRVIRAASVLVALAAQDKGEGESAGAAKDEAADKKADKKAAKKGDRQKKD